MFFLEAKVAYSVLFPSVLTTVQKVLPGVTGRDHLPPILRVRFPIHVKQPHLANVTPQIAVSTPGFATCALLYINIFTWP